MVYGEFFGEIVAKWKKEPNLEGRFFWVQGKNLEGVHVKQQSEGGGGGREIGFNFFYLITSAWERGWKSGEAFRALFRDWK